MEIRQMPELDGVPQLDHAPAACHQHGTVRMVGDRAAVKGDQWLVALVGQVPHLHAGRTAGQLRPVWAPVWGPVRGEGQAVQRRAAVSFPAGEFMRHVARRHVDDPHDGAAAAQRQLGHVAAVYGGPRIGGAGYQPGRGLPVGGIVQPGPRRSGHDQRRPVRGPGDVVDPAAPQHGQPGHLGGVGRRDGRAADPLGVAIAAAAAI